jgi:hypothetical protein
MKVIPTCVKTGLAHQNMEPNTHLPDTINKYHKTKLAACQEHIYIERTPSKHVQHLKILNCLPH